MLKPACQRFWQGWNRLVRHHEIWVGIPLPGKAKHLAARFEFFFRSVFFPDDCQYVEVHILGQLRTQVIHFNTQFQVANHIAVLFPRPYITQSQRSHGAQFDSPGILSGFFRHEECVAINDVATSVWLMHPEEAVMVGCYEVIMRDPELPFQMLKNRLGLRFQRWEIPLLPGLQQCRIAGDVIHLCPQERDIGSDGLIIFGTCLFHDAKHILVGFFIQLPKLEDTIQQQSAQHCQGGGCNNPFSESQSVLSLSPIAPAYGDDAACEQQHYGEGDEERFPNGGVEF